MVATPDFGGETYDDSKPLTASIEGWDWLIFRCFRTWITRIMPESSLANIERLAAGIPVPTYAIDDQTAIKVVDGAVEVVSEGHWKLFAPSPKASQSG